MNINHAATADAAEMPQEPSVPAPVGILFNLPETMQTPQVLRALICADQAGYQRRRTEERMEDVLGNINLSRGRAS